MSTKTTRGVDGGYQLYPLQPHPLQTVVIEAIVGQYLVEEKEERMEMVSVRVLLRYTRYTEAHWGVCVPAVGMQ